LIHSRAAPMPWPACEPQMPIAVVGAHLAGQPLNGQLTERGATRLALTRTAPCYRLHALAATQPAKPGLRRVASGGVAIEVEVWSVPARHVASFLQLVTPPLGIGSIELEDGRWCHGFVCEPHALEGALDISAFGGWRGWLASRSAGASPPAPPAPPSLQVSSAASSSSSAVSASSASSALPQE
jgi:allophanate hydrolase